MDCLEMLNVYAWREHLLFFFSSRASANTVRCYAIICALTDCAVFPLHVNAVLARLHLTFTQNQNIKMFASDDDNDYDIVDQR